jgi:hypothetical protein
VLMEEALRLDPNNAAALNTYGHYLMRSGDPRGLAFVERACELLITELRAGVLSENDAGRLEQAARTLGKGDVLKKLEKYERAGGADDSLVREEYLVAGSGRNTLKTVE